MTIRGLFMPWAGLASGPIAWAINTQLNYALLPFTCTRGLSLTVPISAGLALVALAGAAASLSAWRRAPYLGVGINQSNDIDPQRFLAGLGMGLSLLFAIVIVTQGAAAFVLNECLH